MLNQDARMKISVVSCKHSLNLVYTQTVNLECKLETGKLRTGANSQSNYGTLQHM